MATLVFFALHFLLAAAIVFHLSREIYSLTVCEETVHYPRPTWCMRNNTTNALNAARFYVPRARKYAVLFRTSATPSATANSLGKLFNVA